MRVRWMDACQQHSRSSPVAPEWARASVRGRWGGFHQGQALWRLAIVSHPPWIPGSIDRLINRSKARAARTWYYQCGQRISQHSSQQVYVTDAPSSVAEHHHHHPLLISSDPPPPTPPPIPTAMLQTLARRGTGALLRRRRLPTAAVGVSCSAPAAASEATTMLLATAMAPLSTAAAAAKSKQPHQPPSPPPGSSAAASTGGVGRGGVKGPGGKEVKPKRRKGKKPSATQALLAERAAALAQHEAAARAANLPWRTVAAWCVVFHVCVLALGGRFIGWIDWLKIGIWVVTHTQHHREAPHHHAGFGAVGGGVLRDAGAALPARQGMDG